MELRKEARHRKVGYPAPQFWVEARDLASWERNTAQQFPEAVMSLLEPEACGIGTISKVRSPTGG